MKHLIQGRNNETKLGVAPLTLRSWSSQKRRSKPLRHAAATMLGDDNENIRNVGVAKALAPRKQVAEENANNDDCPMHLTSV